MIWLSSWQGLGSRPCVFGKNVRFLPIYEILKKVCGENNSNSFSFLSYLWAILISNWFSSKWILTFQIRKTYSVEVVAIFQRNFHSKYCSQFVVREIRDPPISKHVRRLVAHRFSWRRKSSAPHRTGLQTIYFYFEIFLFLTNIKSKMILDIIFRCIKS